MTPERIVVEPRNVAWLALPGDLLRLRVWTPMGTLCDLYEPSDALAQAALYECAVRYAREHGGNYSAPPLTIEAIPRAE